MDHLFDREIQDELYEQFARICKALGSARRFEMMELLSHGEHSVEQLARETNMSIANTSQHLQHLKASRLVHIRRKGVEIYYRLADATLFNLVQSVQQVATTQLAEVDRIVDALELRRNDIKVMPFSDLDDLMNKNEVYIIDVRPLGEYDTAHIKGAVHIPLNQFESKLSSIPGDKTIVIYCRSYYSSMSDKAVLLAMEAGLDAYRMINGFTEWKYQGRPTE